MKKKGFTLAEMLMIVAILGMIVLIVTPQVSGLLKKMDNEKYQRFLNDVFLATEAYIQTNIDKYPEISIEGKKVYVYFDELIRTHYLKSDVYDPKNKKTVKEEDFTVEVYLNSDDEYTYKLYEKQILPGPNLSPAISSETHKGIMYLDPTDLTATCHEMNSTSTTGTKTGCMKWYIYDDSGDNYKMILDHNTTATIAYETSGAYKPYNEASIKTQVDNDTTGWDINLNTGLISANEIANIVGKTGWNSATAISGQDFYFGSNNNTGYSGQTEEQKARQRSFAWLFDYTGDCENHGCTISDYSNTGYWTSSSVSDDLNRSWYVRDIGQLSSNWIGDDDRYGIRPVITVSKSVFNQ